MTPNLKFDPKTKIPCWKLCLGLTDHSELKYVNIGRICDFLEIKLMRTGSRSNFEKNLSSEVAFGEEDPCAKF